MTHDGCYLSLSVHLLQQDMGKLSEPGRIAFCVMYGVTDVSMAEIILN